LRGVEEPNVLWGGYALTYVRLTDSV